MTLTTRKMSSRHEDDLVGLLGGTRTRNSGAVWSDQSDGHQLGLDQHWTFSWDGKSSRGKSISITRDMIAKMRVQSRGLLPAIPLRFYRDDRLTEVDEDWIAVELDVFAQILSDANAHHRVGAADLNVVTAVSDGPRFVDRRLNGVPIPHDTQIEISSQSGAFVLTLNGAPLENPVLFVNGVRVGN